MSNPAEVLPPQNSAGGTPPQGEPVVTISQKDLDDLKHKAEVSSQNFERAKKAEQEVKELKDAQEPLQEIPDGQDDTVAQLATELSNVQGKLAKQDVIKAHPQLEDLWTEFEEFRTKDENKGMNLKTAAKSFLIEKDLLTPQRKGLEKQTGNGGNRAPNQTGMTSEDVRNLRETNYKKYREMLKKGQIKVTS